MKRYINFGKRKIMEFIKFLDRFSLYPLFYPWVMTKAEKAGFDKVIKNSKQYLEFGSGGSTIRAVLKSKARIWSVDSSKEWLKFMRKYIRIRIAEGKRLDFYTSEIGKTKDWGFPVDDSAKDLFPKYSAAIFETLDSAKLDTIFIDGRFRVACTLATILQIQGDREKTLMIHDFWHREHYHKVLEYLETVEKIDSLGIFKVKAEVDLDEVKQEYEHYKFDPR